MRYLICLLLFTTCKINKPIEDDYIFRKHIVITNTPKPDTIVYLIMWNNDTITEQEFNMRWDRALDRAEKKIKQQMKN